MSLQDQAYRVLKNARDILTKRLVERILDSADDIIDDASGESYGNDIEQVYEQCGMRLQHIQNMMNLLPPPEPMVSVSSAEDSHSSDVLDTQTNHTEVVTTMVGVSDTDHAFAQMIPDQSEAAVIEWPAENSTSATTPTFADFARLIMAGDLKASAQVLSVLLDLPLERTRKCAEWFHHRLQSDANFLQHARRLRESVSADNVNESLDLLWQCFGLQGYEAVAIWPRLQAQLSGKQ